MKKNHEFYSVSVNNIYKQIRIIRIPLSLLRLYLSLKEEKMKKKRNKTITLTVYVTTLHIR